MTSRAYSRKTAPASVTSTVRDPRFEDLHSGQAFQALDAAGKPKLRDLEGTSSASEVAVFR
jgi:hypothetical protein